MASSDISNLSAVHDSIYTLHLSARAENALIKNKVYSIELLRQIFPFLRKDSIRGLGTTALKEITRVLQDLPSNQRYIEDLISNYNQYHV